MRIQRPSSVYGSIVAAVLCVARLAPAADAESEARERYERALKLYEQRAFDAALVELKLAAELRPSYKLFYNIAQVRLAMNDFAAALDAYRQYLEGGGDKVPAARRETVQQEMKRLEQRVARIHLETDVPGAEVFVDDVSVGTTPLSGPLLVNSGIRQVVVRHASYVPQSRRLSVGGGTQHNVRFTLVTPAPPTQPSSSTATPPDAPALPSTDPSPTAAPPSNASPSSPTASGSSVPWIAWGVTAALAAGTGVIGGLALAENASLKDDRDTLGVSRDALKSKGSRVSTLATVADTLAVATLVAGGVSLWLTLSPPGGRKEQSGQVSGLRIGFNSNQLTLAGDLQ